MASREARAYAKAHNLSIVTIIVDDNTRTPKLGRVSVDGPVSDEFRIRVREFQRLFIVHEQEAQHEPL